MLADYCWTLIRESPATEYKRQASDCAISNFPPRENYKLIMDDYTDMRCLGTNPLFPREGNFYRANNGFLFSDCFGGPFVKNWLKENFKAQDDDIYVVSHPKTGTTWVKELVYLIGNNLNFNKANSQKLYDRCPFIEYKLGLIKDDIPLSTHPPRYMNSHFPYSELPESIHDKKCKIVYTIRNPKDTVVSYYHFCKDCKLMEFTGDLETFLDYFLDNKLLYSPFWKHVLEFWEHRHQQNILLLFYEDMKMDLPKQIKRLSSFLGKELTDDQILQLTEHCHFDKMKNNPNLNYDNKFGKKDFHFFRKGDVGDWKNYLTEEMSEKLDNYCEKYFKNSGLEFTYEL